MKKWEDGDRMTAPQEDYVAGRLEFQAKQALNAKPIRHYIALHPGCGSFELAKQFGHKKASSAVGWLLSRMMIRCEGQPRQFYVIPL